MLKLRYPVRRNAQLAGILVVLVCGALVMGDISAAQTTKQKPPKSFPIPPEQPVTLEPEAPSGATTLSYPSLRYIVNPANNAPWASARNNPQQLFIGSAKDGSSLDVTGWTPDNVNYVGYLGANGVQRSYCAWIMAQSLDNANQSSTSICPGNFSLAGSAFSQYINCDNCNKGWATNLTSAATFYRNVYPWSPGHVAEHATISRPAGYGVNWRYVSEDGNWVAIADPDTSLHLNWFFVARSKLPANLCVNPQTPTVHPDWGTVCGP